LRGIIGTIGGNWPDALIFGYLVEKFWQHGAGTHIFRRDFAGRNFQCILAKTYMYLALESLFGASMRTSIPLAFTFRFDANTVDKRVHWASFDTI
jgi:hypothetical protein